MPSSYENAEEILRQRELEKAQIEKLGQQLQTEADIERKIKVGIEKGIEDYLRTNITHTCPLAIIEHCPVNGRYGPLCKRCKSRQDFISVIAQKNKILDDTIEQLAKERTSDLCNEILKNIREYDGNLASEIFIVILDGIITAIAGDKEPDSEALSILSDENLKIVSAALLLKEHEESEQILVDATVNWQVYNKLTQFIAQLQTD